MATPRPGATHHDRCWAYHLDCAQEEIVRLRNQVAAVINLADVIDAELDALEDSYGIVLEPPLRVTVRIREAIGDPT